MLAARMNTSKQNVMKARDGLRKRGLIDFSKGEGKGKPALYTLRLSEEQSQSLSQLMTQQLTESLASELPQSLPHSNIKEENTTKEVGEEKQSPSSNSKVVLTLSELMEKLLNDNSWLLGLSERLAKNKIILNGEELKDKVREFFSEQEHKGCKGKEEADCREYVFNWIKYKYKNYYGNESKCNGQISTIKIEANRPEDYTGYC
jgi:hypothetical protein